MLNANHPLLKLNPVIQFIIVLTIVCITIALAKLHLFANANDWNIICFGLLFFVFINAILGIFQNQVLKYIGLSIVSYILLLAIFLFMGKFQWIDSIRKSSTPQLIIIISALFYMVLTVVTQIIRVLYIQTQKI